MIIFAKICISDDYRGFILLFVHPACLYRLFITKFRVNVKSFVGSTYLPCSEVLLHSLRVKMNFHPFVYTAFSRLLLYLRLTSNIFFGAASRTP